MRSQTRARRGAGATATRPSHSGVAAKMFDVLANTCVNIQIISTSEIKISVVIDLDQAEEATQAVHDAFLG